MVFGAEFADAAQFLAALERTPWARLRNLGYRFIPSLPNLLQYCFARAPRLAAGVPTVKIREVNHVEIFIEGSYDVVVTNVGETGTRAVTF